MITSELSVSFACTPDRIFSAITNQEQYTWRSDLNYIDIITPGIRFIEYTKSDAPTIYTVTARTQNKFYAVTMENNNMKGRWTAILEEIGTTTQLTVILELERAKTLVTRLFAPSSLKRQQKRYINDLSTYLAVSELVNIKKGEIANESITN